MVNNDIVTPTVTVPADLVSKKLFVSPIRVLFHTIIEYEDARLFVDDIIELQTELDCINTVSFHKTEGCIMLIMDPTDSDIEKVYRFLYSRKIMVKSDVTSN